MLIFWIFCICHGDVLRKVIRRFSVSFGTLCAVLHITYAKPIFWMYHRIFIPLVDFFPFFLFKFVRSIHLLRTPSSVVVCRLKCCGPKFCLCCVVYVKESTYWEHSHFWNWSLNCLNVCQIGCVGSSLLNSAVHDVGNLGLRFINWSLHILSSSLVTGVIYTRKV
jgi:hypothetical protein